MKSLSKVVCSSWVSLTYLSGLLYPFCICPTYLLCFPSVKIEKDKYKDAIAPIIGKSKQATLENSSFDRTMLIETVFTLIEVCRAWKTCSNMEKMDAEAIAEACAAKTKEFLKTETESIVSMCLKQKK